MMSEFKFCPMCGVEREGSEQFCHSCDFEYLAGSYVKSEEDAQNKVDSNNDNLNKIESEDNDFEKKIDVQVVSQEEFVEANDLIKSMSAEINESIDKCLNKMLFDFENDSNLKNSNSDLDASIFSRENLNISIINEDLADVEFADLIEGIDYSNGDFLNAQRTFADWIIYNQSHLPGFIINKYKEPVIANINKLTLIIGSLESIEIYDGLNRFLDILNDYLHNQESFLNNF